MSSPARSTPPERRPATTVCDERLVRFPYVLGVVVGVLRRHSIPRRIRADRRLAMALPYVLINLLAGWWALPRGPLFTLGALWTCLRGGEDVTPGKAPLAPALGVPAAAALLLMLSSLPPLAGLVLWRELAGRDTPWVLVNGLRQPYPLEFSGRRFMLDPDHPVVLRLGEGTQTWTARLPRGETRGELTVRRPWYAPWSAFVGVVNPDGAGVLLLERADYAASAKDGEYDELAALGGAQHYVVPRPDYVLSPFPTTLTSRLHFADDTRTRLTDVAAFALSARLEMLERSGPSGSPARCLTAFLEQLPEDREVLDLVVTRLPQAEALAVLLRGFDVRPLPVELHRRLQDFAAGQFPGEPLVERYATLAASDPADGRAAYLAGRANPVLPGFLERLRRAVAAARPYAGAWLEIAHARNALGDWNGALAALEQAPRAGEHPGLVFAAERAARYGLGDPPAFLELIQERRRAAPLDEVLAAEELRLRYLIEGEDAARACADRFLSEARAALPAQGYAVLRSRIQAVLSDTLGRGAPRGESRAASLIAFAQLGAVGELVRHAKGSEGEERTYLLLEASLVAAFTGHEAAAQHLIDEAFRIPPANIPLRLAADFMANPGPEGAERLTRVVLPLWRRRVLLAALALRHPEHRRVLAQAALQSNADPSFPHTWIARLRAD